MYLLDTHVLLWYFMGSEKLGNRAKNAIEKNLCFYSTATLWELGIKQSINKIDLKLKISELENIFIKSAFLKLEINAKQIDKLRHMKSELEANPSGMNLKFAYCYSIILYSITFIPIFNTFLCERKMTSLPLKGNYFGTLNYFIRIIIAIFINP